MSGTKFLLDTNVILYLLSGDNTMAALVDGKEIYVSFITELELLGYPGIKKKERQAIQKFLNECTIININNKVKERTIEIRKKYKLKLPDSIIAATSEYLQVALITADDDFKKIEDSRIIIYEV